ncbi:hypothetical protein GCM10010483_01570 [Actinokineospora diospyrosa]
MGWTAGSASTGASSMITCALVPLTPNDDTPARRTRSPRGHGRAAVNSDTAPADQSTCRDGSSTNSVAGNTPADSAWTTLITPATPAAAWVCPMLDFTDPNHSGSARPCP